MQIENDIVYNLLDILFEGTCCNVKLPWYKAIAEDDIRANCSKCKKEYVIYDNTCGVYINEPKPKDEEIDYRDDPGISDEEWNSWQAAISLKEFMSRGCIANDYDFYNDDTGKQLGYWRDEM